MNAPAAVLLLQGPLPSTDATEDQALLGETDADARAGLWLSLRLSRAFGPGTDHHSELDAWILPMRARAGSFGAAYLPLASCPDSGASVRAHAQALCDQMGLALERAQALRSAQQSFAHAQSHKLRNTLLAAISHDYRTPLATILGAASSLQDQGDRLTPAQRKALATCIFEVTGQLGRLTDNTLQLARLDAPGLQLQFDWESAEEIVGTALRRARVRDPAHRVRARLDPDLPLLRCDAQLLGQLLDNLIDNALKYSDASASVEILVRRVGAQVLLAVRDRGPGVPPAWRQRIFEVFQRGNSASGATSTRIQPVGAGVGLAVCRAIAQAHGGELTLRSRAHGGSSFECLLPVVEPDPIAAVPEAIEADSATSLPTAAVP